jgi:hypothetical protein
MTSNVFEFPKDKIVREVPTSNEEVERVKVKGKQNYADGMAEEIAASLLIELENFGVDTARKDFNKDFVFLADVIKCVIYRNMDLEHGLQSFIDENVILIPANSVVEMEEELAESELDNEEETKG